MIDVATYSADSDGERIQNALDEAGGRPRPQTVRLDGGAYEIEAALEIPSETTLLLRDATVRLADGAADTVVRNANPGADENVGLVGRGRARIDGNATGRERVDPWYRNFGCFFSGVDGLRIDGVAVGPTNAWAIAVEDARDVRVTDVTFAQDGATPNQDGLHVLGPAERVVVDGVTGTCGDDVVALDVYEATKVGHGDGGDVRGVTVGDVTVRNVHSAGLLRTVAAAGYTLDGVYASNLQLLSDGEEGDAVLKIGSYWNDVPDPTPEEHRNVVIDGVGVDRWSGPFCTVQQPVGDLTVRSARGRHDGPFFYSVERDVDGLSLVDCRTTVTGGAADMVNDFHEPLLTGEGHEDVGGYDAAVLEDPPGAIAVENATVTDAVVRDATFRSERTDPGTTGVRVYPSAAVDGLLLENVTLRGFETGVDVGTEAIDGLRSAGVRHRDVETPWRVPEGVDLADR